MPAQTVFFTIASANYTAYVRTLMDSVRRQYPDAPRYLFLADEDPGDLGLDPGLMTVVPVRQLPIPHFDHIALRYSILELNTAMKPYAFLWLAERHPDDLIVYLDPDILVLAPLAEVVTAADAGALAVVTPHLTAPVDDGKLPDELAIMRAGTYNLGFIAIGPHAARNVLASWWAAHLEYGALVDFEAGTFTDQKWIELVPGMFPDVRILRHPGYNLAYWNLAHRAVSRAADGTILANGLPVAFVHFSGVDPANPDVFSKHQDRFDAHGIGDLRPVFLRYLDLLSQNGQNRYARIPYAYARLRDGTPITSTMRAVFRYRYDVNREAECADPFGLTTRELSTVGVPASVLRLPPARRFSRVRDVSVVRVAEARLLPPGSPARRTAKRLLGRTPPPAWVPPPPDEVVQARTPFPITRPTGLETKARANVIGYVKGEFGVAEGARNLVRAARARGVDVAIIGVGAAGTAREADLRIADAVTDLAVHPVNILCVNADQTPIVLAQLGAATTAGRYTVGYWFWELARFPEAWRGSIDLIDEIWVASEFVAGALRRATDKPVVNVRMAVDATPSRTYARAEFALRPDRLTFLFTMDFHSYVARKQPGAVVDAFRLAFPRGDEPVALLLKTTNGDRKPDDLAALRETAAADSRVEVRDGFLSRDEAFGLMSVVDCYVSLHRSEGFGLGLAESMSLGKPVIGTAYSGNMEFMDGANSCLVGYSLIDVGPDEYPFAAGQVWADPDMEHAAFHMRRLSDTPAYGQAVGERARAHMRLGFSFEAVGDRIERELVRVLESRG
jgi:glycosyltransferase involved in cell wall biosynthesis